MRATRILSAAACDMRLQFRHGFYLAAAFVGGMMALGLSRLPAFDSDVTWMVAPLVVSNLILGTFYFVGGLVLLEKGEGTLDALVVTPLRAAEYLASKVLTLALLAAVENVVIVGAFYGVRLGAGLLPFVLGISLASAQLVLLGFVAVARYDSINEYLAPSALLAALASLPILTWLMRLEHWSVYLHPLQAPMLLMQGAFVPLEAWQWLYGVAYSLLSIVAVAWWSRRTFDRFVVGRAGVR